MRHDAARGARLTFTDHTAVSILWSDAPCNVNCTCYVSWADDSRARASCSLGGERVRRARVVCSITLVQRIAYTRVPRAQCGIARRSSFENSEGRRGARVDELSRCKGIWSGTRLAAGAIPPVVVKLNTRGTNDPFLQYVVHVSS